MQRRYENTEANRSPPSRGQNCRHRAENRKPQASDSDSEEDVRYNLHHTENRQPQPSDSEEDVRYNLHRAGHHKPHRPSPEKCLKSRPHRLGDSKSPSPNPKVTSQVRSYSIVSSSPIHEGVAIGSSNEDSSLKKGTVAKNKGQELDSQPATPETLSHLETEPTANVTYDDPDTPDWSSDSSLSGSDSEDLPNQNSRRLEEPREYFQRLDEIQSKVLQNSNSLHLLTNGSVYNLNDNHVAMNIKYSGDHKLALLTDNELDSFYRRVLEVADEFPISDRLASITLERYNIHNGHNGHGLAIRTLYHFIECRNLIFRTLESIESMQSASYCGTFISIVIMDKGDDHVARLHAIKCSQIKQLATTFESCLFQLAISDPSTPLFDTEAGFASSATDICRDILGEHNLNLLSPDMDCTELWRCTIHTLDIAVLSYAGTHTEFLERTRAENFHLPGPFLHTQHFTFRRRRFLCLDKFLDGKEAWVLERYSSEPSSDLPKLYLSTNAETFADIWGPMWKCCAVTNGEVSEDDILQYNVGSGVILPWNRSLLSSNKVVGNRKDEIFCHWISDKDIGCVPDQSSGERLHPTSMLLIGASMTMFDNGNCHISAVQLKQHFRDSGALSELGTIRKKRVIDTETVQMQVGPAYIKVGAQLTYKRRGVTWKKSFIEAWKNNPEGRNVRLLECRFGVEVSACTNNARRRRLITLLGSDTMINYLRNITLTWESSDCEREFYSALKSSDYKTFRKLYKQCKDWRADLGKAIMHCLEGLSDTGTDENRLDLLWVPDKDPGQRVSISLQDHEWIGYLKDTETVCTMAILEDKCLLLPNLDRASICQSQRSHTKPMGTSILETSCYLNANCLPKSMELIECRGHGGSPRHKFLWRTSSMDPDQELSFGENGVLKLIEPLGNGQILAMWRPASEIWETLKSKIPGRNVRPVRQLHQECIRDEKMVTGPLYVLIASTVPEKLLFLFGAPVKYSAVSQCGIPIQ